MRSTWEHWRANLTGKRLFRCRDCQWRGWGVDRGPTFTAKQIESAARAIAPEPPNLKGTALATTRPVAASIDFDAIDAANPFAKNV